MVNSATFDTNSSIEQEDRNPVSRSSPRQKTISDGELPVNPLTESENSLLGDNLAVATEEDKTLCCRVPLDKVQEVLTTFHQPKCDEPKPTRKLLCLYCERSFASANLRQKHVERIHSVKKNRRLSSRKQQLTVTPCIYCDKLNNSENTLIELFQHLVNEHSNKYFGCVECEERFLTITLLHDHNGTLHPTVEIPKTTVNLTTTEDNVSDEETSVKLTRSRTKPKLDTTEKLLIRNKNAKLKELRSKKLTVKSSRLVFNRRESKRLQALAKITESQKKKRQKPIDRKQMNASKPEAVQEKTKPTSICVNPYPEFDNFYRVKKITDHSIDNLKISSLTFDDVFDKAFFNRIKCNIEENLLHHIDGKLFKNEESESRISNFEKVSSVQQEIQNSTSENYGCELSLNAVTPVAALSLNSQFGEDFEYQIEYGSKPSKKKTQTKKDEVHYKYFTRRKFQASILEQKENRDLSKLDMWTQLVIKKRQQKIIDDKKTAKEMLEYTTGDEYKNKIMKEELNRILDRRGPFEDLREEASKKAALDKLNSASEDSISHESFTDVREVLNEILNRVFAATEKSEEEVEEASNNQTINSSTKFCLKPDLREIPSFLNLRRTSSLPSDGELDQSDKITLICSSQDTENFELPTNATRGKNELIELSGEWARCRMYICAACGAKLPNMKYLLDHKTIYHQNVWVQHYEFVGNQSELYRHLSIPALGKVGYIEDNVACKLWKRSDARVCSKCKKQCNSLGELHRHILECGGDWTWILVRKKCKYRYGAKSRRRRRGMVLKVRTKRKTDSTEKKINNKYDGPRQRPSDAETIQRMLANLPAKRSTRKLISLYDGVRRRQKTKELENVKQKKVKCGKVIYDKSSNIKETTEKTINTAVLLKKSQINNKSSNARCLRSLSRVLSSRILDTNTKLTVKRKLKVLNERRRTRQSEEIKEKDDTSQLLKETKKKTESSTKEITPKRTSPRSTKMVRKMKLFAGNLNIKSFFPVKKRKGKKESNPDKDIQTRSKKKSEEEIKEEKGITKITKSDRLSTLVRSLSTNKKKNSKKTSQEKVSVDIAQEVEVAKNSASKEELELTRRKRKLKQSFRNVINRVKRLKIDAAPELVQTQESQTSSKSPFLDDSKHEKDLPLKIVIPSNIEAKENIADISETAHTVIPFNETNEVPEIIFKLDSDNEKSLQAKGEFHDIETETKLPIIQDKLDPISIETSLKPKVVPLISPNMKGKIRKPARGLNDCIAMLTSKLQQKSTVDTVNTYPPANLPKIVTDPSPQIAECILKIPTFRTQQEPTEELALDLSTKSRNQEPENPIFGNGDFKKLTSVERIIENVVNNKFQESRTFNPVCNSIDQTIQNVIDGHLKQQKTVQLRTTIDNIIDYVINFNSTTGNNLNETLSSLKPKEKAKKVNKKEENTNKIVASEDSAQIIEEATKEKIVKVSKKRSKNKTESPEKLLIQTNLDTKLNENNIDKVAIINEDEPTVLEIRSVVQDISLPNPIGLKLGSSTESKSSETKSKLNLRNFRKQTKILKDEVCSEVKINNEISDNNTHQLIPEKFEAITTKEKVRKTKTKIIKKTINEFETDKINHEDCQIMLSNNTSGKNLIISYKTKRRRKRTKKLRFTQRKAKRLITMLPVTYSNDQIDHSSNEIIDNLKQNVLETNSTKSELSLTSDTPKMINIEDKTDEIIPATDLNIENHKFVKINTILKPAVLSITSIMKIKKDEDIATPQTSISIESETPVDKKLKKPKRKGRKSKRLTVPKRRTFKFLPLSDTNEIENLELKTQLQSEANNSNEITNVFENNKMDEENIESNFTEIDIHDINESISELDNTVKKDNKQQKKVKKLKRGRAVKINKMLSNKADMESINSELDNAVIENMTQIEKLLESEEGSLETKRKLPNRKSKYMNKSIDNLVNVTETRHLSELEQPSNESLEIKRKLPDRKSKSIKKSTVHLNTSNIDLNISCPDKNYDEINEVPLVEDVEEKILNTNVQSVNAIVNIQKTRLRRTTRSLENLNAACDEDTLLLDKKIDLTRSLENLNAEIPENIDFAAKPNTQSKKSENSLINGTIELNKIPEDIDRSKEDILFLKIGIESLDNLELVKEDTPLLETVQHIEDNLKSETLETFPDTKDLNLKEQSEETILVRKGRPKRSKLFKKQEKRPNSAKTLTHTESEKEKSFDTLIQRSNSAISLRLTKFKRKISKSASLESLNTVTKNFNEQSITSNETAPEFNLESKIKEAVKESISEETKNIVIEINQSLTLNEDKKLIYENQNENVQLEDNDSVFQDEIRHVPDKNIKDKLPKEIPKVKQSECIIRRTRSSNNIMTSSNESLSRLNDSLDAEVSKIMGYSELTNYQKMNRYSINTNSSESESSPRKSKRLGRKSRNLRKSSNTFSSEESMNNSENATPSDLPDGDFVCQKSIRPLRKSKLIKNVVTNGEEVIAFPLINNTEEVNNTLENSNSDGSDIKLLEEKIRNAIRNSLITMSGSSTLDNIEMSSVTSDSTITESEEIKDIHIIETNRNETNKKPKKSKKTNNRLSEISDVSDTSTEVSSSRSLRRKSVINYAEIEEIKEPSENLESDLPITDLIEINNSTVINNSKNETSNEDIEEEEELKIDDKRIDNLEIKSQENSYILKENLSKNTLPQIKNGMNKKRTKLRAKKGKRRFIRNQKTDVTIPEVAIIEPTTLLENIISDSTIQEIDTEKEPPIKIIINKHKARRKSKSIKKVSLKGHNDLYEDFALVIKKKRRAPIITFSPPDTFSKEDTYPMEVHHVQKVVTEQKNDLVDSVEEVDMELEELPIKTNIIETTKLDLPLPELKNEEIIQTPVIKVSKVGGRKKRGKSRVNRKKSSPRTIANSILNEEIPVLKLNLNTQDSYSSDIANNTSTSVTSELINNFVLDKDDFSSDDFEVDNSFEDSIICDDDTPKKPSVDADTLFDKLIESSETLQPLILKKNKILKKKGGKKIKNRTQFATKLVTDDITSNEDTIDNLIVTNCFKAEKNIIKDEFLKPVIKLSRKGRKKGGRAKWKFRNLSVEKLINEELDNFNKDTDIIVALSKEISEIENNLLFEDTPKPDELKKDDIDKLYAFSETEDFELEKPLELPRRLPRKNENTEEETNNINITEKPDEETKVYKRKSKDDDIPTVSDGRKSMRSAKVKALETIHDEALAELTDCDKITAIDSESKKFNKRGKKIVNNFDLSSHTMINKELLDIDIINDIKSTKIATIDSESKKSNKKGKKVIGNFDFSIDAMVNNNFPELTDIDISDDKKINAFDSESKKINKNEKKVVSNFDFSTDTMVNNEFPELTDIDYKKTTKTVLIDLESKKSNIIEKKIISNFDFSISINNELTEITDIDKKMNKTVAVDSENKKSNKKWKKINTNFDFAKELPETEPIKTSNEEQNNKKLTKKQKKTDKYLHLTESFDIPREVLGEAPLLEDLVAELDGLEELENSIERELNAENEKECIDEKKELEQPLVTIEENQELRRSRRGSRKVTSYNENDLIDPLINVLENIKVVKKKEDKAISDAKKKKEAERKLNSEELFDLLKASTNDNLYVPKQQNSFLNNLEDSSRDVAHENFENMFENMLENTAFLTQKKSDIDKIYEFTESPDNNDEPKTKITKSKKLEDIESSQDYTSDSKSRSDNYCEICNKSFVKLENLIKHRRTLTHIQKLSEIEAKEAEKSKIISRHEDENSIESVIVPPSLPSNSDFDKSDLKIGDILINKDNIQSPFNTNHSLKLADIISDVLNKPVLPDMDKETNTFSDIILQNDTKRYKSLGERKSFDSDSLITSESHLTDSFEPKTTKTILEKQISLLENIIENQTTINYIDDISLSTDKSDTPSEPSSPIVSKPMINNDSFLKPTQYEEISEDSANVRNYDDQKLRKTLNRDEELFLECCSLLKSSSEVSSSYSNKKIHEKVIGALGLKPIDEPEWMEKKNILYENNSNAIDYSDNSRIPTPLGNSYDDEASNSNTISSNWGMDKSVDASREKLEGAASRFSFKNVTCMNNEDESTMFEGLITKNRAEIVINENKSNHGELSEGSFNDNKKIMTKGARKVFEGLKVSIPTEELNMEEVLNNSPKPKKTELPVEKNIEEEKLCSPPSKRKSKPVKKAQVGSNLLFKVNKKKLPSPSIPKEQQDDKGYDVYDFEETQDNTDVFTKPNYREFRTLKVGENESEGEDLDQFVQPILVPVAKKTKAQENITKKKCMIMGRIFKNAAKSKIEDIDEEIRTIPVIDNEELVENYVAECKKVITSKSETEIDTPFDHIVEDKIDLEKQSIRTSKKQDIKKKTKLKGKKRLRTNSDSTDDEFSLCKTVKRKTNRKNAKEEDNCINLEQELKECIGVASRKSQRKCTSGKQNVLVEYWSSDESQFEALLEKQIIEIKPKLPPIEKPVKSIETEVPPVVETPVEPKKKKSSEKKNNKSQEQLVDGGSSNRRKRAAVNPLYHWSSSSEDEANDLIEVKPLRDEIEDDEDRPVQHGWIVGDSPKKLVTMLAQAKGKKADIDCVKEQGKKRTNPVS